MFPVPTIETGGPKIVVPAKNCVLLEIAFAVPVYESPRFCPVLETIVKVPSVLERNELLTVTVWPV
jgi:hypothetical protein